MSGGADEREVTTEVVAGLGRWLPVDLSIRRTVTNRWTRRGEEFNRQVEDPARVSPEEVRHRVEGDETFGDLYASAGIKAATLSDAPFRTALATLVSAALKDDAKIDEVAYLTTVVTQLEPIHLRYLWALGQADSQVSPGDSHSRNFHVTAIAQILGLNPGLAQSVAERLHSLALTTDRMDGDMLSWTGNVYGAFALTDAGRLLLSYGADEM